MNKKVISIVFGILASSLMFISAPIAQAGDCSAEDPCNTYAMVNDAGVVTNVIVCQPSVCGSGVWAGSRVVLQVAANPETHENAGSIFGGENNKDKIVTVSSDNVFTVTESGQFSQKFVSPDITINKENTITTSMGYTIETKTVTTEIPNYNPIENTVDVLTVKAEEVTSNTQNTIIISESIVFENKKTQQEVQTIINDGSSLIFKRKIMMLMRLLGDWF
jgi:hypothetical protein